MQRALEDYFAERGFAPDAGNVVGTIATNTTLVPKRAHNLLVALEELAGVTSLKGLRVVEAGSGFGALASYLAVTEEPETFVGIDVRADYVHAARASADAAGLADRLRFAEDDMREFATVPDQGADLVILNNAFLYLPTRADMRAAIQALARVTAPGGHVLFFQANKWTPREPFTKDPLVHLMPAPLARATSRLTGWQHNHGRVRLLSPPALGRMLRRAGFEAVGYGAFGPSGFVRDTRALAAGFFAATGRRRQPE